MKKFVVIARNISNGNCAVITQITAATRKEAQQIATRFYYMRLNCNEQMIVADKRQFDEIWRHEVEKNDAINASGN